MGRRNCRSIAVPPVSAIFLLFDRGVRRDRIENLLVGAGTGCQPQVRPQSAGQFVPGALVHHLSSVEVKQVSVNYIEPDVAGGFELVQVQVTGFLLQVDVADRVNGHFVPRKRAGIDYQRVNGTVADRATGADGRQRRRARIQDDGAALYEPFVPRRGVLLADRYAFSG